MTGFTEWRAECSSPWLSFPLRGNGLSKPLDSGLRRNDVRGLKSGNLPGMAEGLSGWR